MIRAIPFYLTILIALPSCAIIDKSNKNPHNALLTSGYGVLSNKDIESASDGMVKPVPPYTPNSSYRYWQCFPTKTVSLKCRSWKDDKTIMGEGDIKIYSNDEQHEYGFRRAWEIQHCKKHLKTWIEITKNAKIVCLLGVPAGQEDKAIHSKKVTIKGWVWDRLKTKKGCDSYFEGDCP
ncbi:MAG: hypothetical protein KDD50_09675 [Bdellovibrionales bacterium]|nr:hypothetical protein [Bdellovibrionales bacterium]